MSLELATSGSISPSTLWTSVRASAMRGVGVPEEVLGLLGLDNLLDLLEDHRRRLANLVERDLLDLVREPLELRRPDLDIGRDGRELRHPLVEAAEDDRACPAGLSRAT